MRVLPTIFCFVLCRIAGAQQAGVEGTVLDATTRQPLAGVHVTMREESRDHDIDNAYGAISRADGQFSIVGMKRAFYSFTAERNGYVCTAPQGIVTLKAGVAQVTVEMARQSAISGHVLDDLGDPAMHVEVEATPVDRGSRVAARPEGMHFRTDERGWYRLRVPPGKYRVKATVPRTPFVGGPEIRKDGRGGLLQGATYADVVEVGPGREASGIDFRLMRQGGLSIGGVVSGGFAGFLLLLHEGETQYVGTDPKGRFTAAGLTPGLYRLVAYEAQSRATAEVRLDAADVSGVELRMVPGSKLTGTVAMERGKLPAEKMTVHLVSESPVVQEKRAEAGPDGAFEIPDIFPGRYRVSVDPLPENAYVKSPEGAFDFTGDPIRIVIGPNGGVVEGKVLDAADMPVGVALVRKDEELGESNIRPAEDGKFHFAGLRPGRYRLVAFLPQEDYKALLAQAAEFEVREGDRISKEVKVAK